MTSERAPIDFLSHREDTALLALWKVHRATKQSHNYLPLYHRHFNEFRKDVLNVLEIGVETNRSVRLWKDYFPNATIWGLDIDPKCKVLEEERIKIVIGDQSDEAVLAQLPNNFDIIIDDGSHIPAHQMNTFSFLYREKLADRGIYVVEDCEGRDETIQFFKNLADAVNFWPQGYDSADWRQLNDLNSHSAEYLVLHTIGVAFYRYIIFIDKGRNPEDGEAAQRLSLTNK